MGEEGPLTFKLDENLGVSVQAVLREGGHDATTVRDEDLCGTSDRDLWTVCLAEGRCLVTLDLDFAEAPRFRPAGSPGIVVMRPGGRVQPGALLSMARMLVSLLAEGRRPAGSLWILEPGRLRVRD